MESSNTNLTEEDEGNPSSESSDRPTRAILFLTFFSALGGFLFGYDTGVVSGAMILIRKQFELSYLWQEIIVSVTILAAWFSSLVGGVFTDYYGRKYVILMSSFIFSVGALVLGFAPNKEALLAGRIIIGLGIGSSSMCVPIYISEVAPLSLRGRLTVTNTLFVTGGQFVASVICGLFSDVYEGWRYMLGLGAIPAFIQLIAFLFAPESPRWLSLRGRLADARNVLQKFRPLQSNIDNEIENLRTSQQQTAGILDVIRSGPVRRALFVGCLLQLFQQISGINTVMYYSASIIAMTGITDDQTVIWLAAVASFFNFSFTFVGLWLVERVGRRPLTLGSLLGVSVALLLLAVSFQLAYNNSPSVIDPLAGTSCSQYKFCSDCIDDKECGFCFSETATNYTHASCLMANHSHFNEVSTSGLCVQPKKNHSVFAYNWCPSNLGWLSIIGLCLYLCFFAPGMGPMPWTINSEIYPNWARARCTSFATSVNWAANLFVSLTFLSLTDAITKQGTFYLYMGFSIVGFILFFLILPETKGVGLENVESIFEKPLCKSTSWKRKKEEFIPQESYGTL